MSVQFPRPEFSRKFTVEHLTGEKRVAIEATEKECAQLARRMNVSKVDWLRAQLVISPWKGRVSGDPRRGVHVTCRLDAQVIQPCSVTLEPVAEHIENDIKYKYIKGLKNKAEQTPEPEIMLEFDDTEPLEPLIGGEIDLGELAAESLGVAINPYPRGQGVYFEPDMNRGEGGKSGREFSGNTQKEAENLPLSPFSGLKSHFD